MVETKFCEIGMRGYRNREYIISKVVVLGECMGTGIDSGFKSGISFLYPTLLAV